MQGAFKNDMIGMEFDPLEPGGTKLKGEIILKTMLGIRVDISKWWDLVAVMIILVLLRVLFFVILKFKERAAPFLYSIYARQTLQRIKKRPSFRKGPSFPSKPHQSLHPLSSQEGLNSPIHQNHHIISYADIFNYKHKKNLPKNIQESHTSIIYIYMTRILYCILGNTLS